MPEAKNKKEVTPHIKTEGKNWVLEITKEQRATGKTILEAVQKLETEFKVTINLPLKYEGFTEISVEDYQMAAAQSGG